MKTKNRKSKDESEFESLGSPQPPAHAQDSAPSPKKERFQLSFDLNEDGTPDLSAMRPSTRKRVTEFFSDPKLASLFDAKPAGPPPANLFPQGPDERYPIMIGSMYNLVGMAESLAAQMIWGIPLPIAHRAFLYTEPEKELLAPPTVKVLNKYAPAWLIKYQDEIALANLLVPMTITKFQMAFALAKASAPPSTPEPPRQVENEEIGKKEGVN